MSKMRVSRRKALQIGAASAALPLVHIRTAGAAGKVSIFFWDHWVPAGNDVMKKQVATWADKNKVDVQADFITSMGNKTLLTINAEAMAKTGHDVITIPNWEVQNQADKLEPVDDVVKRLEAKYGPANPVSNYLGKSKNSWLAVPSSWGTQNKGPCGRISILKEAAGFDVVKAYPASAVPETPEAKAWTVEAMLKAAEACQKVGKTFAIGLGTTADNVDTAGSLFAAFGAEVVDAKGDIQIKSDAVRQVLEYGQRLVKALPADAVSFDDSSNNRALISGNSALIWNPPSAWAVAIRDAPDVAKDCWTFAAPSGPKGRFMPHSMNFWGIWKFAPNKSAAKELVEFLMQQENVDERSTAVLGYDLPPFLKMNESKVWDEVGPPKGSVYNYPVRPQHHSVEHIAVMPAPPEIAVQIYNRGTLPTMFAKLQSGQTIPQVIAWASSELEGFVR
jgi:ABC-type glycerol-3-phosphate transport system substrate-binding protein